MIDMNIGRTPMPMQSPEVRCKNFTEVALGYGEEEAKKEASRCLNCKNHPCVGNCPVHIAIPDFIQATAQGHYEEAYRILRESSSLPAVCGRVCPQESQCEKMCVRGIKGEAVAIGRLERFVADWHNAHGSTDTVPPKVNGHKVAIIGSGPSSLACAGDLARRGYSVTVFEALHELGGVLRYGIPDFRLPKEIVEGEIQQLSQMGVDFRTDMVIGRVLSIDELLGTEGYEAVYIGTGAGLPRFMNIPGENLNGVYSANEYLTRINLMGARKENSSTPIMKGGHVVVVGGGNVAMDAARCARRMGGDVTIVYRRTEEELPARKEEVAHAREEGIRFMMLHNPIQVNGRDGWVTSVTCQKMTLGEPDSSGRRSPVPLEGQTEEIIADTVIIAIGTSPNPLIRQTTKGLDTQKWGGFITDEEGRTSREGVWAGGDAVTGAATVILAMGAGKTAAASIDRYIQEKK